MVLWRSRCLVTSKALNSPIGNLPPWALRNSPAKRLSRRTKAYRSIGTAHQRLIRPPGTKAVSVGGSTLLDDGLPPTPNWMAPQHHPLPGLYDTLEAFAQEGAKPLFSETKPDY